MINKAIKLAVDAHEGQTDKAGAPYIFHPLRVMLDCETETERIVAVLHDIVENTSMSIDDLRGEGFSEEILEAVDDLSRKEGEAYDVYIERLMDNPIAMKVKLADLRDNMNMCRLERVEADDWERYRKYKDAAAKIVAKLYPDGMPCKK